MPEAFPTIPLSADSKIVPLSVKGTVSRAVLRIRDVYPGSGFFSHPGSQKIWGGKKIFIYLFSYLFVPFRSCWNRSWLITVAQNLFNLITILNYFHFLTQENIGFKLSEIMVGSGIRKKTYSGSRIQGTKRSRIRIRNTAHEIETCCKWYGCVNLHLEICRWGVYYFVSYSVYLW